MFVALAAEAQNNLSFKTEELKKVAAELKLEGLDTLKIGYTFIQKNNHQLVVRKAEMVWWNILAYNYSLRLIGSKRMVPCLISWRMDCYVIPIS